MLKWLGYNLLTTDETISFLKPYEVLLHQRNIIDLPDVENCCGDIRAPVFFQHKGISFPGYVWLVEQSGKEAKQLAHGAVLFKNRLNCTDYTHAGFYHDIMHQKSRKSTPTKILVAPWSQYLDGIVFGGYYDYVFLVLLKLCRIKDVLTETEFKEAVVSYPLFDTSYEREYLAVLGIAQGNIVDSRYHKVKFKKVVLANSGHWVYPNLMDVQTIKKHVELSLSPVRTVKKRIYISRRGRRVITNEKQVIAMLKRFDFLIIEDVPISVAEQVQLYKNASFIIGPHGASFSNVIWCEPGTHLYELFSPGYMPDFFLYLAKLMKMEYSAYYYGQPDPKLSVAEALVEDIFVAVDDLENCLREIFEQTAKKKDLPI